MANIGIVGGGIVGLATAYQLQKVNPNAKVTLFEKESSVGQHQTSHNSGVIHSGIYYRPGSLKAQNCLEGYSLMVKFCQEHGIPFELCGKLIIATQDSELPGLEELYQRGIQNGLQNLNVIGPEQIKEFEPHATGLRAIHVPQTGIIQYLDVAQKLKELILKNGGEIILRTPVEDFFEDATSVQIETTEQTYRFDQVIFCSGLFSDRLAKKTFPQLDVRIIPFRGEYFLLKPESQNLVKHLIYPVPDPQFPFLGVHYTRMMGGGVEVGPNAVLALAREGYRWKNIHLKDLFETVTWPGFHKIGAKYWKNGAHEVFRSFSKLLFWKSACKLIPSLKLSDLTPGGSGVRAQACSRDGKLLDDFEIRREKRCIHVLNAPSPAATSSLSIGLKLAKMVDY